ncbi:MAG: UvrD-helicase domain-containing protein [Bacteroidota bacterium]
MNIKVISAGAGSGKTYRLTHEMVHLLRPDNTHKVRPSGIIATTFTKKAAAELKERVRQKLLEDGYRDEAKEISNALIGTVHSVGAKLLKRFAFEAGVSPEVDIIAEEDQQIMFNQSLATVLTPGLIREMELLAERLGLNKNDRFDWRNNVRTITELARANNFSEKDLELSADRSIDRFFAFLPEVIEGNLEAWNAELLQLLEETIYTLRNGEDSTKVTLNVINVLQVLWNKLNYKEELNWFEWVKISKLKPGAKSREAIADLKAFAKTHEGFPEFRKDISAFISTTFNIAINAIQEYESYKKSRGLIDYTDMEVSVLRLLNNEKVRDVIVSELDLLMVDEFQDTNPIQLEIFLKLSKLSKHSIWVGDPKQSIYGFRGAEPALMKAVIDAIGGVKPEDIQDRSWRSRADLVYFSNTIFCKAFNDLPEDQVALTPQRTREKEPLEMGTALWHWHFQHEGESKRPPGRPWFENCIVSTLSEWLLQGHHILPKGSDKARKAKPGDVAILCRSNSECQLIAKALHKAGMKASISRSGLLETPEAKLIMACLKFILHPSDSLSVAELLLLSRQSEIEDIIEDRLEFLEQLKSEAYIPKWSGNQLIIRQLNELREKVKELSGLEILDLILEELDLRRTIASWGDLMQRMDNVDAFRKMALDYEESCNRLNSAASLGGLLLWINERAEALLDEQGSGENENAVNVLTYHKSKGLEWPVVICHSLESSLHDKVWGMAIEQENYEIDLEQPLSGRWLRYWINPYADQHRGTNLQERVEASEIKQEVKVKALKEEARLLYVGITRARDYLILTTRKWPSAWLNRVGNEGDDSIPFLDLSKEENTWNWKDKKIPMNLLAKVFPRDFGYAEPERENIVFLEPRKGAVNQPDAYIDPYQALNIGSKAVVSKISEIQFSSPLEFKEGVDEFELIPVVSKIICGDRVDRSRESRLQQVEEELDLNNLTKGIRPADILDFSEKLYAALSTRFPNSLIRRNFPINGKLDNKTYSFMVDLLLDSANAGNAYLFVAPYSGSKPMKVIKTLESRLTLLHHTIADKDKIFIGFLSLGLIYEIQVKSSPIQMNLGL